MSIDLKNIVFITNHYRRSFFFEQTLRLVLSTGARVVIQNTSGNNLFGTLANDILNHPRVRYVDIGSSSYDAGMSRFKASGVVPSDAPYIVLLDNDCFVWSIDWLKQYIDQVVEGGYDFVCHTVGIDHLAGKYEEGKVVGQITDLTFKPSNLEGMSDVLSPNPHFENALLVYSKRFWDGLTPHDLSHHRRVIMAAARLGVKIGAHKVDNFRWSYSQFWGDSALHVGNLFPYHLRVEAGQTDQWRPDSDFDLFRAGFYAAEERAGVQYHPNIASNLNKVYVRMGGKDKALRAWDTIKSTPSIAKEEVLK